MVDGATSATSLLRRDHSSTLFTLRLDLIQSYSQSIKTHLLFFGPFEIKIKYKKYKHTTNYRDANLSLETRWYSI